MRRTRIYTASARKTQDCITHITLAMEMRGLVMEDAISHDAVTPVTRVQRDTLLKTALYCMASGMTVQNSISGCTFSFLNKVVFLY